MVCHSSTFYTLGRILHFAPVGIVRMASKFGVPNLELTFGQMTGKMWNEIIGRNNNRFHSRTGWSEIRRKYFDFGTRDMMRYSEVVVTSTTSSLLTRSALWWPQTGAKERIEWRDPASEIVREKPLPAPSAGSHGDSPHSVRPAHTW